MSLSIIITFSVLLLMISLWIKWRKRKLSFFQRYGIPGPKPNFVFGNLIEFNKRRDKCIEEWVQRYGKIFGFYLGAKPLLVCADVEFLKICQIKDINNFYNRDMMLPDVGIPHDSSLNMLVVQEDEKWKIMRDILNNCFTTGKIKSMSTLMSRPIKIFLQNIEKQEEEPFDIAKLFKTLAFDIIATSAFGVTTNVQRNQNNKFVESIHAVFLVDSTDILAGISMCFPEVEPICTFIRHKIDWLKYMLNIPSVTLIYDTCKNIIESRKKLKHQPQDLLQSTIDAKADCDAETETEIKKLPDDFVIANSLLFMAAGYDSTRVLLIWCIHFLVRNPEMQERVRQEIKKNVSDDAEIQYSDLSNFPFLEQVISEALRFWPLSFLIVNRVCSIDYHYKGMTIPKGSIIAAPVQILQNDPEYWNEPDKFNPDRFSSGNRGEIDSNIYQPFGAGPRICIGQKLGKTMISLILANLLRSFKLEIQEPEEVQLEYGLFFCVPKNGVIVKAIGLSS